MSSTVPPLPTGTSDLGATPTHTELARGLGVSLSDNITLSFHTIQTGNINSAMFGGLVIWGLWSTVEAARIWNSKRAKPIYILNVLQTVLNLFKITTATTYAVVLNLYCEARAPLINVAQTVCWDLIYMIMLLKLLLFTPYKRAAQVVYGCVVLAHFVVVMVGVGLSQTNLTVVGTCRDRYPLIYKQQYLIELALEIFTFLMLLHGMTHRSQNLFEGTKEIFKQLKENENLRVFMVTVFITGKIIMTYYPITAFDSIWLAHGIDSARSALVCWALEREQYKIQKVAMANHARKPSSASIKDPHHSNHSRDHLGAFGSPTGTKAAGGDGHSPGTVRILKSSAMDVTEGPGGHPVRVDIGASLGRLDGEKGGRKDSLAPGATLRGVKGSQVLSNETVAGSSELV